MKLARIEHWRCGEPISWKGGNGWTYVWVPDEMTAKDLSALCEKARDSYLEAEREFKKLSPVSPPGYSFISPSTPDTKTVGELKSEYEAQAKAYKEHQAAVEKSRKHFAEHLKLVSGGEVIQFWEHEPDLEVELSWGHSHIVSIQHSPTNMGDYPFPQAEDNDDDDF